MNFKHWLLLTEAKKSSDIAKELLDNNDALINQIKSIIPTDAKQDLQAKLLPIAAYYYKQQPNINTLKQDIQDYADLVKLNKMQIITVNDDLTINNDFKSYIHWTEIIDGKKHEGKVLNAPIQGDLEDQELIAHSPDNKIKVYKANSVNQCIVLGKGESFCISQPANTMFQSYRDTKISTFYFVYDNTRTDDLAIVVVDATKDDIQLTDRKNQTAQTMQDPYSPTEKRINSNPDLYFKYLQEKGIDTNIFKNIPKSPEEEAEHAKLGKLNYDLNWFKSLTPEEKSKYIGRGYELSDPQFEYLYDNNFTLLLKQYVKTGVKVETYQLNKIAAKRELKDIYLHNRLIADKQLDLNDFSKEEFALLNPKQKEEFYNFSDQGLHQNALAQKLDRAIQVEDFSLMKELIEEKGQSVPYYAIHKAIKNGNLDLVKYFIKHGARLDENTGIRSAITYSNLNILKYLVEEKNQQIKPYDIEEAFRKDNVDIIRYLIDEKNNKIPQNAVNIAAMNGRINVLKYLIDEKNNKITSGVVKETSLAGQLDVLKYFFDEKGFILNPQDFRFAINLAKTQEVKDYLIKKQAEQK